MRSATCILLWDARSLWTYSAGLGWVHGQAHRGSVRHWSGGYHRADGGPVLGADLKGAEADFRWIHEHIPGKKIILKGNHDYWWSTAAKFYKFCAEFGFTDQWILNNNAYEYGDYAICGTRGWFFEESRSSPQDEKVFRRELMRLETSLKAAGDKEKLVFLHYPPRYKGYTCDEILELLRRYEVRRCFTATSTVRPRDWPRRASGTARNSVCWRPTG